MDWSMIPEIGTVGILALMFVELGKNWFPSTFRSDTNVWLSMFVAVAINAGYTLATNPGDFLAVWNSVPQGAMTGLTVSGLYRGIAGSSKKNSVDMSEQIHETIVTTPEAIRAMVNAHGEEDDEREPMGFKTK